MDSFNKVIKYFADNLSPHCFNHHYGNPATLPNIYDGCLRQTTVTVDIQQNKQITGHIIDRHSESDSTSQVTSNGVL